MAAPLDDKPVPGPESRPAGADLRHDLRTPINQIIGYSEMLQEDAADTGQDKMSSDLKKIGEAARRMLELIDRIPDQLGAPTAVPPPAPTLQASELVYDGGKVVRGVPLRHVFVLKNTGTTELSIDAKPG